jgi:hypothetical protein
MVVVGELNIQDRISAMTDYVLTPISLSSSGPVSPEPLSVKR